jgi:hypothetical protein
MSELSAQNHNATIRATRIWLERAVIGLNLCPFAKAVHVHQRVRYLVSGAQSHDELLEELSSELHLLKETDPDIIETTLLIHPDVLTEFIEYSFFLTKVDSLLSKQGFAEEFQVASFHPYYEFSDAEPDDIENYTNRSPYPTLHLIRESSIERAVSAFPDASDIYDKNIENLRRLGHEGWQRLWIDDDSE